MELERIVQEMSGKFERDKVPSRLSSVSSILEKQKEYTQERAELEREQKRLRGLTTQLDQVRSDFADYKVLQEMAANSNEEEEELRQESWQVLEKALDKAKELEMHLLMSHEADPLSCFLEVQAGAGGTDSMDWAEMLLRMYTRWSQRIGYTTEEVESSPGEVAGIKSACVKIVGEYPFGWLKHETGIHRLVRISPFDSNARRHTSFASVFVSPVVTADLSVELNKADLKIETYKSSGPGGQHVNTTDSAVRITHLPTGIVAKCQSDRSQHRNRDSALQVLKSRLMNLELKKREKAESENRSAVGDNSWGNQIRSYVLQPYQMVKDVRTGVESTNASGVLEGEEELDSFLKAALLKLGP